MPILTLSSSEMKEIEERVRKTVVEGGDDITGYIVAFAYGVIFAGVLYIVINSDLNICASQL